MLRLEKIWDKHYAKCVIICYWLFGLCNNFAYVIMLSAAHDILSSNDSPSNGTSTSTPAPIPNKYDCNVVSTGAILLADTVPGVSTKILMSFFAHRMKYTYQFIVVVILNLMSFFIVSLVPSNYTGWIFFGVCCASVSSSLGEVTFLSMSSLYKRKLSLAGWGSGTGAAGLFGSLAYAAMTAVGISPRATILLMNIEPVIFILAYILLPTIAYTKSRKYSDFDSHEKSDQSDQEDMNDNTIQNNRRLNPQPSFKERMLSVRPLVRFMIPLFLVYYAEYFINQGLYELLYFRNSFVKKHEDQYRWYNVIYQLAVFISRSSIRWVQTKQLWIFPLFQVLNVAIALTQIYLGYLGSIWFIFLLIFWEGLLGGGCYVNAFNQVSIEVPKENREYSMAFVSIADGFGIALAGATAIPAHNVICKHGRQ